MSTAAVDTPRALPAGTWTVDPVHSQVGFAVGYHVGTFRGSFTPVDAKPRSVRDGAAKLSGSVAVSGVRVQDENLAAHLKSPDFFDAERAPEITFVSSGDPPGGRPARDRRRDHDQGHPTGHGPGPGRRSEGVHGATLLRPRARDRGRPHAFGINWNNPLPNGEQALANEVTITAELSLMKAVAMHVLAIPGSLRRDSHNSALLRAAGSCSRRRRASSCWKSSRRCRPMTRTTTSSPRRPPSAAPRRRRRRRRAAVRHPRVQLLDPGPAEERARLGLAPAGHERAAQQAGRGDRREHRGVRRGLGAGGAAQGARRGRRPRPRRRARGRACGRAP